MLTQFRKSFLTAEVFARRAYAAAATLSSEEFYSRSRPDAKALIEEVLPIAALVKYLNTPGLAVTCRYGGGDGIVDATLRFRGNAVKWGVVEHERYVEVTTAEHPKEYLRREALRRDGAVYGGPGIRRVGSKAKGTARVDNFPIAFHGTVPASLAARWTVERIRAKAARSYPLPCILLVNVVPERRLSLREWVSVSEAAAEPFAATAFVGGYLIEAGSNTVIDLRRIAA